MLVGSPEWFAQQAKSKENINIESHMESLRELFLKKYSPEKLLEMDGEDLLENVFSHNKTSMMYLLMFDSNYRWFGASSEYTYLGIIYKSANGIWTLYDRNKHIKMSPNEAKEKAEFIRDKIVSCANIIDDFQLDTIDDYKKLSKALKAEWKCCEYVTVLKYFQMLYPYYFPGMYSSGFLKRALKILGLPYGSDRIINAGELALFIRRCGINNIVFNNIYAAEWGWHEKVGETPCEAAISNKNERIKPTKSINTECYSSLVVRDNPEVIAEKIENELDNLNLVGETREAVVKQRVNQGEFRKRLLNRYENCCLCGVSNAEFLVASHIKPWAVSEAKEKLDVDNGFLLCPHHDKLFDKGYISFDDQGNIVISNQLSPTERALMNVSKDMRLDLSDKNKEYLKYHREHIFKS